MSMAFVSFGCNLLMMMPSVIEIAVWMGMDGFVWNQCGVLQMEPHMSQVESNDVTKENKN